MYWNKKLHAGHINPLPSRKRATVAALSLALALVVGVATHADARFEVVSRAKVAQCNAKPCQGLFDLYQDNRSQGVGNIITNDFLVTTYGLLREQSLAVIDREVALPQLQLVSARLSEAAKADSPAGAAAEFKRFASILQLLLDPATAEAVKSVTDKVVADEVALILAANSMSASPLLGRSVDYSQYLPRGRYSATADTQRLFRAMKFAGQPLLLKESKATGITRVRAASNNALASALADAALKDEALLRAITALENALAWQYGSPEDLQVLDLVAFKALPQTREPAQAVATDASAAKPGEAKPSSAQKVMPQKSKADSPKKSAKGAESAVAAASPASITATPADGLYAYALKIGRVPSIWDVAIDMSILEKGLTPAKAAVSFRLIPGRSTPDGVFFQQTVFPLTGKYTGKLDAASKSALPFGLSFINGQPMKGNVSVDEWLAALGSKPALNGITAGGETKFANYEKAFASAAESAKKSANGLANFHLGYLRATLGGDHSGLDTARGFWIYDRHATVLFAKQSMTPLSKSLPAPDPVRTVAAIDVSPAVVSQLASVVDAHLSQLPVEARSGSHWRTFRDVLEQIGSIATRADKLTVEDMLYLNNVDRVLRPITGDGDAPIVADFHTNPTEKIAITAGIGYPFEKLKLENGKLLRGGVFNITEFKQPLAKRLTDEAWRMELIEVNATQTQSSAPARPAER
jgi:hypothetical protein